jgi:hypothetical protein
MTLVAAISGHELHKCPPKNVDTYGSGGHLWALGPSSGDRLGERPDVLIYATPLIAATFLRGIHGVRWHVCTAVCGERR